MMIIEIISLALAASGVLISYKMYQKMPEKPKNEDEKASKLDNVVMEEDEKEVDSNKN